MEELCEAATKCNRDQMTFKGILARNLAYFYRVATDESIKTDIMTAIDTTVAAMVSRSCDVNWNCGGNWVSLVSFQPAWSSEFSSFESSTDL